VHERRGIVGHYQYSCRCSFEFTEATTTPRHDHFNQRRACGSIAQGLAPFWHLKSQNRRGGRKSIWRKKEASHSSPDTSAFLPEIRNPRRSHNALQRARCSAALRSQMLELAARALRLVDDWKGGDAKGRLSIASGSADVMLLDSRGAPSAAAVSPTGCSVASRKSESIPSVWIGGDKASGWRMNTSRRSSSWQPGQVKMWCSKPGTIMVSSGTVCTKRISSPHTMQRMIRTHADWCVIERPRLLLSQTASWNMVNGTRSLCAASPF